MDLCSNLFCFVQQFIVPMGSKMHFRVRMGAPFAENPVLLVNLPEPAGKAAEESKGSAGSPMRGSEPSNGGSGETRTGAEAGLALKK